MAILITDASDIVSLQIGQLVQANAALQARLFEVEGQIPPKEDKSALEPAATRRSSPRFRPHPNGADATVDKIAQPGNDNKKLYPNSFRGRVTAKRR